MTFAIVNERNLKIKVMTFIFKLRPFTIAPLFFKTVFRKVHRYLFFLF